MKRLPLLHFVAVAIVLILSGACARKPDDTRISSQIQSKFSQDSGLSSKQLAVQNDDGVVTLSGNVENNAQRDAAGRQAASVSGVRTVINNLQVGPPSDALAMHAAAPTSPSSSLSTTASSKNDKPAPERKSRKYHDSAYTADPPPTPSGDANAADPSPPVSPAPPASTPDTVTQPTPPPTPKQLFVDQGTQVAVRLIDPIDTEKNQVGDSFHGTLNAALTSDGETAIPAGVELIGHVVDIKNGSKFAGQSLVLLQLDSLSAGGKTYNLQTDQYRKESAARGKNTAEKVGGGAIIGGIIGALAGGGKGAAIGTAAGAGVGGGVQAASKSPQIKLPPETILNFVLQAPITVMPVPSPNANRPKLSGDSPSQPQADSPATSKPDSQPQ
jgi:BON domain